MTPKLSKADERPESTELNDVPETGERERELPDVSKPEPPKSIFSSLRDAYERARDGQKRPQPAKHESRTAKTVDRSKGLLILAGAVVIMIFVFLGMFSSSSTVNGRAGSRLGRSSGSTGQRSSRRSIASARRFRIRSARRCGRLTEPWKR